MFNITIQYANTIYQCCRFGSGLFGSPGSFVDKEIPVNQSAFHDIQYSLKYSFVNKNFIFNFECHEMFKSGKKWHKKFVCSKLFSSNIYISG